MRIAARLLSPRRPIVVLRRLPNAKISAAVAPGNNTIGVMLPYTPLHYLLFSDSPDDPPEFTALVMTSGNHQRGAHCHVERGSLGTIADR